MDIDDRIFEEPDNEEELLLQGAMEEFMLQDENEISDEIELDCDISAEELGALALETEDAKQKKPRQK